MIRGQVHGLKDLERALLALPREIAGKNGGPLRTALRAAARPIRDEAQVRAPEDTGRLKKAIAIRVDRNPVNVTERLVVKPRRGRSRDDERGAFYWFMREFGTEKSAATPYLRPAFEVKKNEALSKFKETLARSIKAAVRRVAKLNRG